MCGRFAFYSPAEATARLFGASGSLDMKPRYNIAPAQPILIVTAGPSREPGSNRSGRRSLLVKWGFLPGWVKSPRDFPLLINARSETAAEKNAFRAAMRHRRMLVPASGYYEWKRDGKKKAQPYWIRPKGGGLIGFGGIWETWEGPEGSEVDTGAILTTKSNVDTAHVHDRMPVVVPRNEFARWLDCRDSEPRDVADLLRPLDPDTLEVIPVSTLVNKVSNAGPEVQEPVIVEEADVPRRDKDPDNGNDGGDGQMSLL